MYQQLFLSRNRFSYASCLIASTSASISFCIAGDVITADAMSMQKDIIDKIREKGADFVIELKANQRSLRYGIEDRIRQHTPLQQYTEGPELSHGRIEIRTYRVYDGLELIADKEKWGAILP